MMSHKYLKTALIVIGLVVLVGGSYVLYSRLSSLYRPGLNTPSGEESGSGEQGAESRQGTPDAAEEKAEGSGEPEVFPAPAFTVRDTQGDAVSLLELTGKPIVLNFWATWCGYCKQEMPEFQKVYEEMGDQVTFMMVNMTDEASGETREKAAEYIKEQGFTFPVYYDVDQEAAYGYQVTGLPITYFLDAEGNIVANARGAIHGETLQTGISMITGNGGVN